MRKKLLRQFIHKLTFIAFLAFCPFFLVAQAPNPALIGYFHNWQDPAAPYIQLDQVDSCYNIVNVSFAIPEFGGPDYKVEFVPDQVSQATFITQIQTLQSQGRKVIISVGGANHPISLDNITERDTFVVRMNNIIDTYGFDGMDINFEGTSLSLSGGTISSPTDPEIIHLIDAVKQIMANYHTTNGEHLILTMAPETAFVQGGQSGYSGIWGAYLPVIDALRDSLDILYVQLYNSGTMYGIDGNIYSQGTADFIVAMSEATIQGFNTAGGMFTGLPASKITVALPACHLSAGGGGFTDPATVTAAIDYLRGDGPQPGSYTLANPSGYPDLRGMMTWSVNWDVLSSCGGVYEYAQNFGNIFGCSAVVSSVPESFVENSFSVYPNPSKDVLNIKAKNSIQSNTTTAIYIYNTVGKIIFSGTMKNEKETIDISGYPQGIYFLKMGNFRQKIIKL